MNDNDERIKERLQRCPKCGHIEEQYNDSALSPSYDCHCNKCHFDWVMSYYKAIEIDIYIFQHQRRENNE